MKLTEEMKRRIDAYFESMTPEEVEEVLKGYGLKEDHSYTLDELKSEVDRFKDYILKSRKRNNCIIDIAFESNRFDYMSEMLGQNRVLQVTAKININIE